MAFNSSIRGPKYVHNDHRVQGLGFINYAEPNNGSIQTHIHYPCLRHNPSRRRAVACTGPCCGVAL